MEIHKPKPWHGLREFLKEYLIIVVGVLTALGAEQAVEWLHWRHAAREAEEHMASEIGADLVNAVEAVAVEPCLQGRIGELANALLGSEPVWKANVVQRPEGGDASLDGRIMPLVAGSPGRQWPHAAWDNALASGALNHLPRERMDRYASLYRLVESARDRQRETAIADAELSPLGFDRPMTAAERTAFLGTLSRVEMEQRNMFAVTREMLRQAHRMGLSPPAGDLATRMAGERQARGACVADVRLPLT